MSGVPIPRKYSVFSRFRLAGVSVIVGVAVVGAIFYGVVNNHFLGLILSRTLGPYSDSLAEHIFINHDPELWQKMARRHGVMILVEPASGDPVAFDAQGELLPLGSPELQQGEIRAIRTAADGTKVTFYWRLWSFRESHLVLMVGLVIMILAVVGSAFWFLQRQLKPLAWLQTGVEAVARGDFKVRVPIVRNDEIGQVAGAFNAMASRVGQMIDDRERLLADVSHELRSPIARMKVALEFVPQGDKRDSLDRDLREMEKLIAVLLEREELRSRSGRLQGEEVDLDALTGEVVAAFADRGPGVEFVSGGALTIHADPALMKLLIQNLLDNAVKFSEENTPVHLELEFDDDGVSIIVSDRGCGVAEGDRERIFAPFEQGGSGLTDKPNGMGMGLYEARVIAKQHGGSLEHEHRRQGGSRFVLRLPEARVDAGEREREVALA